MDALAIELCGEAIRQSADAIKSATTAMAGARSARQRQNDLAETREKLMLAIRAIEGAALRIAS